MLSIADILKFKISSFFGLWDRRKWNFKILDGYAEAPTVFKSLKKHVCSLSVAVLDGGKLLLKLSVVLY